MDEGMTWICVNENCSDHGVPRAAPGACSRCQAGLVVFGAPEDPFDGDAGEPGEIDVEGFVEVFRFGSPAERPAIEGLLRAYGIRHVIIDDGPLGPYSMALTRRPRSIVRVEAGRAEEAAALLRNQPPDVEADGV